MAFAQNIAITTIFLFCLYGHIEAPNSNYFQHLHFASLHMIGSRTYCHFWCFYALQHFYIAMDCYKHHTSVWTGVGVGGGVALCIAILQGWAERLVLPYIIYYLLCAIGSIYVLWVWSRTSTATSVHWPNSLAICFSSRSTFISFPLTSQSPWRGVDICCM